MIRATLPLLALMLGFATLSQAKSLEIATDIAPVQAIVAGVTGAAQTPRQLIETTVSTHDFSLKPSDIRRLQQADLIIWLGAEATPGLAKLMARPEFAVKTLTLMQAEGVMLRPLRPAGLATATAGDQAHHHSDPHAWLDPDNATLWATEIAEALAARDPDHAAQYRNNADSLRADIASVVATAKATLGRQGARPYVQFHDAFQYFEASFGLASLGAATTEDEESTSLGIISDLRDALADHPASCVFVQNPAQEKRARALLETPGARVGWLDALGRGITVADYSYPALLGSVVDGFADCLFSEP